MIVIWVILLLFVLFLVSVLSSVSLLLFGLLSCVVELIVRRVCVVALSTNLFGYSKYWRVDCVVVLSVVVFVL